MILNYLKNKRILLVDDEPQLRHMVTSILSEEGFTNIRTAGNVREAVTAASEFCPEFAILDVMLPDGDGFSLMEHLKNMGDYPILRRTYKDENPLVTLRHCEIDFERAEIKKEHECIPLTAKEYALLLALYRNAGRIVTIDALCEAAWGDNPYGYENSLMAHIRRIREKIEKNPSKPEALLTVKGLGYKLIVQ